MHKTLPSIICCVALIRHVFCHRVSVVRRVPSVSAEWRKLSDASRQTRSLSRHDTAALALFHKLIAQYVPYRLALRKCICLYLLWYLSLAFLLALLILLVQHASGSLPIVHFVALYKSLLFMAGRMFSQMLLLSTSDLTYLTRILYGSITFKVVLKQSTFLTWLLHHFTAVFICTLKQYVDLDLTRTQVLCWPHMFPLFDVSLLLVNVIKNVF